MLTKHKIFDFTLWISTVLCCSLALFSTVISGIFSLLNVFLSPNRVMNGPISMYLWSGISGLFHVLALIIFTVEFHLFIKKNVLTKEELEAGWVSTNRAQLSWSFYLLLISVFLIIINIAFINCVVRLKRSFIDLSKNQYDTNLNLINGDNNGLMVGDLIIPNGGILVSCTKTNKTDYQQMVDNQPTLNLNDLNALNNPNNNNESPFSFRNELRSSRKLKRIIDFIY